MSQTNQLCPCADLDWRGADMTLPHHPECKAIEVQTVGVDYLMREVKPLSDEQLADLARKIQAAVNGLIERFGRAIRSDQERITKTFQSPEWQQILKKACERNGFGAAAVPFDGSIDSVEVSSRALTQDELLEMAHKKMAEVDFANDRLVACEPIIMPMGLNDSLMPDDEFIKEYKAAGGAVQVEPRGKFYALGYTTNHEWRNVTTVVDFLHCGLNQKVTFSGFKRELSCVKCEAVACFPDDFEF